MGWAPKLPFGESLALFSVAVWAGITETALTSRLSAGLTLWEQRAAQDPAQEPWLRMVIDMNSLEPWLLTTWLWLLESGL